MVKLANLRFVILLQKKNTAQISCYDFSTAQFLQKSESLNYGLFPYMLMKRMALFILTTVPKVDLLNQDGNGNSKV